MMDRRLLKIILIMVCSTFAMLAVAVGIRLYLRAEANHVPDQIKRADTFVDRSQRDRAAELLLDLKNQHPNPGQRRQIDSRLSELGGTLGKRAAGSPTPVSPDRSPGASKRGEQPLGVADRQPRLVSHHPPSGPVGPSRRRT